jgi:hypothetical protein
MHLVMPQSDAATTAVLSDACMALVLAMQSCNSWIPPVPVHA